MLPFVLFVSVLVAGSSLSISPPYVETKQTKITLLYVGASRGKASFDVV